MADTLDEVANRIEIDARSSVEAWYAPDDVLPGNSGSDRFWLTVHTPQHEVEVLLTATQMESLQSNISDALNKYRGLA